MKNPNTSISRLSGMVGDGYKLGKTTAYSFQIFYKTD